MSPEGPDDTLTSNVPHRDGQILKLDGLDVEPDGGNGDNIFVEFKFVKNSSFAGCVKAQQA